MRIFVTVLLGLCIGAKDACASPWPVEASIAYVEQLQLACAKVLPEKKEALQSRMELLFSEGPQVVSRARSLKEFGQMTKWAQDEMSRYTKRELIDQCDSFLVNSNLALHREYPPNLEPIPKK